MAQLFVEAADQMQMTRNIGSGFRDADGALCGKLVRCLDFMNELPFFKAYKSHSWRSLELEPGQVIVDVACGTGFDLIQLARQYPAGHFIGVDKSENFIAVAKERAGSTPNIQFFPGVAEQLPLGDRSVDGARIDRSLQHVESPAAVLREMLRVTRIGGRIVACEPDWETFILFNGEFDDSRKIAHFFQHSIRNRFIGRELASLMNQCGIENLRTHVHAFCTSALEEADVIFDLRRVADQCRDADLIAPADVENWLALSEQASHKGIFFAALNIVETSGLRGSNKPV
ncbi:MAG: methyltransferase domain-containing protein [Methylocystis sp.]